ncbi:MAG: ferritin-like domain-containing protein [Gemmatimonadaceae bacterium]
MPEQSKTLVIDQPELLFKVSTRRSFLKLLGVGGTIVLMPSVFAACADSGKDSTPTGLGGGTAAAAVSLNLSGDLGILNYAYALEQLEAAFYTAVVGSSVFSTMNAEQQEVMLDLRNHEVIHREFFKAALGTNAIPALTLNGAAVASTLTSIPVILQNAEAFEDLGVSAYNGAGKYLASPDYLLLAGKIVSVEARHAAAIRDMRDAMGVTGGDAANTRFAGDSVVNSAGLDVKLEPSSVLGRVGSTKLVGNAISIGTAPTKASTPDAGPPSPTP